jgi:DNA-binding XRE family transcriptional regulator
MATAREQALQEELRLQQEIDAGNARRATLELTLQTRNTAYFRRRLRLTQEELARNEELLDIAKQRTKEAENIDKKTSASLKSFARLSGDVKKNLGSLNSQSNIYVSVQRQIIQEEETRAGLSEADVEASEARAGFLRDISSDLLTQAKATAKAEQDAKGINEFEQRRIELQQNSLGLTASQLALAKDLVDQEEALYKKEQRINSIKESQKEMFDSMPDGVKSAVGFAQKLGDTIKTAGAAAVGFMLLATVVAATLASFTSLDQAAGEFAEKTGITNTQMQGIRSDANEIVGEFGDLGIEAKNVFDTVAALKSEFSDVASFSKETTAALTVLNANFGVSAESAAKVQSQFESIGGLSSETAANVQLQVANMANLAGVAPAKVFEDIAENAEATSTFFKGDLTALAKNAVQARRMGTSLKEQVALAEKLLDFESGIEEELVAATFVGGQFNLGRARALAMEGKLAEANEETLKQIQRSGDFRKQDYFTQQQLAKAAGMSVEEINKQLNAQEKLNSLTTEQKKAAEDAISKGLDITNINADQLAQETEKFSKQQEQQQQLEQLNNAFAGIASTVGSVLTPLLSALIPIMKLILFPVQLIAEGFKFLGENLAIAIPLAGALAIAFAPAIIAAITTAVGTIMSTFAQIPFGIGVPLGIAAVAGLFSMISKAKATAVGDMNSPADGKTQVSTKEGGLFELSPNDDLVAAPGAASALANAGNSTSTTLVDSKSGGGSNLAALSAPLNAMINEIKALRADLNSGKIAVYMDTAKVTSNISTNVDQGTRNSYNLGSA